MVVIYLPFLIVMICWQILTRRQIDIVTCHAWLSESKELEEKVRMPLSETSVDLKEHIGAQVKYYIWHLGLI